MTHDIYCHCFSFKALQYHEDYAEALASYEHALELDGENEDARNNQDQLISYLRTITDLIACKVCALDLRARWSTTMNTRLSLLQGRIKSRKFKTLISVLNETPPSHNNSVPLQFLRPGENEDATYRGTVVASLGVQDVKLYALVFTVSLRTNSIDVECSFWRIRKNAACWSQCTMSTYPRPFHSVISSKFPNQCID